MTILDYYFGHKGAMGSFESTICKAWELASFGNKRRIEKAFPEYFPTARMYGTPFGTEFRDYPSLDKLNEALQGRLVTLNRWGSDEEAILTTWDEIERRGFVPSDRSFNTYNGKPVLQFNHAMKMNDNGTDLSFITYETLEEITAK